MVVVERVILAQEHVEVVWEEWGEFECRVRINSSTFSMAPSRLLSEQGEPAAQVAPTPMAQRERLAARHHSVREVPDTGSLRLVALEVRAGSRAERLAMAPSVLAVETHEVELVVAAAVRTLVQTPTASGALVAERLAPRPMVAPVVMGCRAPDQRAVIMWVALVVVAAVAVVDPELKCNQAVKAAWVARQVEEAVEAPARMGFKQVAQGEQAP